jgi:hypothetical protein
MLKTRSAAKGRKFQFPQQGEFFGRLFKLPSNTFQLLLKLVRLPFTYRHQSCVPSGYEPVTLRDPQAARRRQARLTSLPAPLVTGL